MDGWIEKGDGWPGNSCHFNESEGDDHLLQKPWNT